VTYRNLRDRIAERLRHQTPRVYGRDRLAFFGNKEPFSATPLVARVDGEKIVLPIGKVHGVREGSEFTTCPLTSDVRFSVDQVTDFECSASAPLIDA
jgi:pyruvate/2-oxoglutarate/acetoin dehydrogenase E1 component